MSDTKRHRLIPKKQVRPYTRRGVVYAWLRSHHLKVAELRKGERPWADIINEMTSHAVPGADDDPPTLKSISATWARVCRDVAADGTSKTPKARPPSRMPPEWRPQEVVPPPPIRPPAQVPVRSQAGSIALTEAGKARAEAETKRIMAELAERDRKKFMFGG